MIELQCFESVVGKWDLQSDFGKGNADMMMNIVLLAVVIRIIVSIIVVDGNAYLRYAEPKVITL